MIGIGNILLTIYFWLVVTLSTIVTFIVCLCSSPFLSQKQFVSLYQSIFGTMLLYPMTIPRFWTIKITDVRKSENRHFDKPYIIIANHASFIDTLVATKIPLVKKFIMAKEFTKIPLFGWLCQKSGHIAVSDRSDRLGKLCQSNNHNRQSAVDLSIKAMNDGSSFMIYPEGSRSKDPHKLLPFKTGAFRLAQKTGIHILPIIIKGTGKAMPIGGFCHLSDIEIIIGDPIEISKKHKNLRDDPQLEMVRKFIQSHLNR